MKEAFSCSAIISIEKGSPIKYAELVKRQKAYKRSAIQFKEDSKTLRFSIRARDATALKATVNSILKELSVVEDVLKVKIPQTPKGKTI